MFKLWIESTVFSRVFYKVKMELGFAFCILALSKLPLSSVHYILLSCPFSTPPLGKEDWLFVIVIYALGKGFMQIIIKKKPKNHQSNKNGLNYNIIGKSLWQCLQKQ